MSVITMSVITILFLSTEEMHWTDATPHISCNAFW